jgi:hypothetical protein
VCSRIASHGSVQRRSFGVLTRVPGGGRRRLAPPSPWVVTRSGSPVWEPDEPPQAAGGAPFGGPVTLGGD